MSDHGAQRAVAPARPARRWNRAASLALFAFAGVAGWWPVLGSGLLWSVPIIAAACLVMARAIPARAGALLLAAWVPVSLLLAGVSPGALRPRELGGSASSFREGADALATAAGSRILDDPWALSAALLVGGATWMIAALLASRDNAPSLTALPILVYPMLSAIGLESTPPNAAWHGALLLSGVVLWMTRGRLAVALPAAALLSLVAVTGAQAFGPHDRWIRFDGSLRQAQFNRLDPTQSYGPLTSRRTGATMLQITTSDPALWRMQALEDFDGRGWSFSRQHDPLPEPAAVEVKTKVRIAGLRNRLIAAPGRITSVESAIAAERSRGDSWRFTESPSEGDTYTVTSTVVRATADQLEQVPLPEADAYDAYTRFWPRRRGDNSPRPAAALADAAPHWLEESPWGDAIKLARRLMTGATTELEVVRRVEEYLTSGRFRYTTDVDEPGADPLLDFLFKSRAGYCQHFAGAATLLLRLTGIPTRVVTGFATGKRTGEDTYDVRDEDAHAWIEVYFAGYGWVPFNPTPGDAEAEIADEVDPLAASSGGGANVSGAPLAAVVGFGAVALVVALVRLFRRRTPIALGELLARLVREPVGPSTTLAAMRPRLATLGPSISALAEQAERARFAADGTSEPAHPHVHVWRALRRDLGAVRATRSLLRAALK